MLIINAACALSFVRNKQFPTLKDLLRSRAHACEQYPYFLFAPLLVLSSPYSLHCTVPFPTHTSSAISHQSTATSQGSILALRYINPTAITYTNIPAGCPSPHPPVSAQIPSPTVLPISRLLLSGLSPRPATPSLNSPSRPLARTFRRPQAARHLPISTSMAC